MGPEMRHCSAISRHALARQIRDGIVHLVSKLRVENAV